MFELNLLRAVLFTRRQSPF